MNTLVEREEAMKFVINGRTFDTATSSKAAISRGVTAPSYNSLPYDSEVRFEDVLYRTAKGAFFLHEHNTEKFVKGGRPVVTDLARELSAAEALEWITEQRAVVIDATGLQLPDEA